MNQACKYPRFNKQEEIYLHRRMLDGDTEAKELLAKSQWPWAVECTRRLSEDRLDWMEIESLAGLAITLGLRSFYLSRGTRLTTHLFWVIRGLVSKHACTSKGPVIVPDYIKSNSSNHLVVAARRKTVSLSTWQLNNPETIGKFIESRDKEDIRESEYYEELNEMRSRYQWAIEQLPDNREREMLLRRHKGETLETIGKAFGISKERVRQLSARAERKLMLLIEDSASILNTCCNQ